jgi:hypothetical protein
MGYTIRVKSLECTRFFAERTLSPVYDLIDASSASGWNHRLFYQRPRGRFIFRTSRSNFASAEMAGLVVLFLIAAE